MRRWLLPFVTLFAAGCGTDSVPQLMNEAAQTKAEFVDKLMRIVDEDTAAVHFDRGKKQYEERMKDVKERYDKLVDNLGFGSFERKLQKLAQPGPDGKPPQANKPGAAAKALGDDWLGQLLTMMEAMEAKRAYLKQEFYTELRMAREQERITSLYQALGNNSPKVGAVVTYLQKPKGQDTGGMKLELFKNVAPQELFLDAKFLQITYEKVNLPPPPKYAKAAGEPLKK